MKLRVIPFVVPVLLSLSFVVLLSAPRAHALTPAERAQLEAQLAQVEADQAAAQQALSVAQSKSSSLQTDLAIIAAKIKTEQLDIQKKKLQIQTLGNTISTKQSEINSLDAQIAKNKQSVGAMFRDLAQNDDESLLAIALGNQTLSQFFDDAITLVSLQQQIDTLSSQLAVDEASSTAAKQTLVVKQNSVSDALYAIQQEQKIVQANQAQQQQLLSVGKLSEKAYSTLVAQKKKEAAAINAKLFALAGGSNPIPFGTAYQYALAAQKATGVDPAFLLAIMTQESNLGSNQGTCYLTDTNTGAGVSVKSGKVYSKVMNPTRDVPPYLQITSALGVDALHTTVSCPQSVGWGGAMGPAQFIASTWVLLSSRVTSSLGQSGMANPWNAQHAFVASALYLADLGAASGGYTAESNAACRYYSGSSCSKSSLIASYGTSVMSLAATIQTTEINKLLGQ